MAKLNSKNWKTKFGRIDSWIHIFNHHNHTFTSPVVVNLSSGHLKITNVLVDKFWTGPFHEPVFHHFELQQTKLKFNLHCFLALIFTLFDTTTDQTQWKWKQRIIKIRRIFETFCLPDVIIGIEVLLRMENFKGEHLTSLLSASFTEIHAQSHVLEDRSRIFAYHQFLLHNKLDQILPMGMDYLLGFIQVSF